MKVLLGLFIFTFFIIATQSCNECCSNETITCPAYKDINAQQWIPYQSNNQQIFSTNSGELDTLKVDSVHISKENTQQNSCKQSSCRSSYQIYSNLYPGVGKKLFFNHDTYPNDSGYNGSVTLQFLNANIYASGFNTEGFRMPRLNNCPTIVSYLPQITLNNKPFLQVQEIVLDTTCKSPSVFRKVYMAKNKGIIGYQTNSDGKLWVLQ